jgi:hypothetical protein
MQSRLLTSRHILLGALEIGHQGRRFKIIGERGVHKVWDPRAPSVILGDEYLDLASHLHFHPREYVELCQRSLRERAW